MFLNIFLWLHILTILYSIQSNSVITIHAYKEQNNVPVLVSNDRIDIRTIFTVIKNHGYNEHFLMVSKCLLLPSSTILLLWAQVNFRGLKIFPNTNWETLSTTLDWEKKSSSGIRHVMLSFSSKIWSGYIEHLAKIHKTS